MAALARILARGHRGAAGISLVYTFWLHTEAVGRLPAPIEAIFNTPSNHRVHHSRNALYLNRLFGNYQAERADEPCRFGLVRNLGDLNLLRAAFHEWAAIMLDLWRARSLSDVLGPLFAAPGWRRDGAGTTSATLRREWLARSAAADARLSTDSA